MEQIIESRVRKPRRSRTEIRRLLRLFEQGSLTGRDFCKQHDIDKGTFNKWKSRYWGKVIEQKANNGASQTFAGQVTAHTMRRTAITTLLILGVPELAVRRISGQAPGSKEFYKFVVIAQEYLNQHLIGAFEKLSQNRL